MRFAATARIASPSVWISPDLHATLRAASVRFDVLFGRQDASPGINTNQTSCFDEKMRLPRTYGWVGRKRLVQWE